MASEKEEFITKKYIPTGAPIVENDRTLIYKVRCMEEPGRPVAILKMYRKRNVSRLYTKLMQLDYSEYPHIYNVKYFDDSTLVVEECLTGRTLQEAMNRNRAAGTGFSSYQAGEIMEQICHNIETLAGLNPPIIHHNLKPSNIFITNTGAVKFLDFVPVPPRRSFSLGKILQNLGVIFHEIVTGKKPVSSVPCPAPYRDIIKKCLSRQDAHNYTSLEDLEKDISYAKDHHRSPIESTFVEIPYTLTVPFQGIVLTVEWMLFYYFHQSGSFANTLLFGSIFVSHTLIYITRRHTFLQKCDASFGLFRRLYPFLILAAICMLAAFLLNFIL